MSILPFFALVLAIDGWIHSYYVLIYSAAFRAEPLQLTRRHRAIANILPMIYSTTYCDHQPRRYLIS
jgi:hypothetical protein